MSLLHFTPSTRNPLLDSSTRPPNPRTPPITASAAGFPRRRRPPALRCKIVAVAPEIGGGFGGSNLDRRREWVGIVRATEAAEIAVGDVEEAEIVFTEKFKLERTIGIEGNVTVRLEPEGSRWRLVVGCDVKGKWILHWGVSYLGEIGSEWDQPPPEMRPSGSVAIKDYAVETPFKKSVSNVDGKTLQEVQIEFDRDTPIAAVYFVLKEEETGAWFRQKGRDFIIALMECLEEDSTVGGSDNSQILSGTFEGISSLQLKAIDSSSNLPEPSGVANNTRQQNRHKSGLHEEYKILKQEFVQNYITVTVRKSKEMGKNILQFDTDVPGDVVVHWGVCKSNTRNWEILPPPHPPNTNIFRHKALQTSLQRKLDGVGSQGIFLLDKEISGVLFVLKVDDFIWLNNMGTDFFVSLTSLNNSITNDLSVHENMDGSGALDQRSNQNEPTRVSLVESSKTSVPPMSSGSDKTDRAVAYTDEIINEIRNLVTGISSERRKGTKSKETQESILREIEKLAAEAYSIFRTSTSSFMEDSVYDDSLLPDAKISSGTGSGYEILCQGFNWESHKSGRWYAELSGKTKEISTLGFTIVWLPPPTESVSPEGYMPKDLYNLNSRYGNINELKDLVLKFHEVGIKVLGDVVLNHRCAHYQNESGVWNLFGGSLNWDDRAIVADDPHFQGRGNKSSGDNFHAAPNIDHSQEFVRKDLKEWLSWLRKDVGYDGWRLDFVRGFWGGYVKDYMESTQPYFAVGEYWDSLSYTYDEMDYNQDAHRQRIIDWINATNGTAGAFDVTTKGILHTALGKCEYWRLSDENGKPPGVVGWWPSRAVTFIENHDTGSTQGHWRFPSGKEMQGYAYILTHPGTPAVFYDHVFSHYQQEISRLISLRHRKKIHCRSVVKITKAEKDVYAAEIDEKIAVKIGPGHFEPSNDNGRKWVTVAEGNEYKVWEAS